MRTRSTSNRFHTLWILLLTFLVATPFLCPAADSANDTDVIIVVGPSTHPPGSHEVAAGGRLVAHCLENAINVKGIRTHVFYKFPTNQTLLKNAATIVFLGDQFPPARLENTDASMKTLATMMNRGCGIVCIHYATGLGKDHVKPDGEHPLLHWTGGYFATGCRHHSSIARIFNATITPGTPGHPVMRGWKKFQLRDEPYTRNWFGKTGLSPGVVPLATAGYPPKNPRTEVVAWGVQRKDGGRGVGITMPHFYRNWERDELRKFILNGIVWTAKLEVPSSGVETARPDLAAFKPEPIDPIPPAARQP